jgi:hypothetical protein
MPFYEPEEALLSCTLVVPRRLSPPVRLLMEVRSTSVAIMGPGGSEAFKSSSTSTEKRQRRGERGKQRKYVRWVAGRLPSQIVKGWSELVNQQQR